MIALLLMACLPTAPSSGPPDESPPLDTGDSATPEGLLVYLDVPRIVPPSGEPSEPSFDCETPELIVARAGDNQVLESGILRLDGRASTGPGSLSYAWRISFGSTEIELEGAQVEVELPQGYENASVRLVVQNETDLHRDFLHASATATETVRWFDDYQQAQVGEEIGRSGGVLVDAPEGISDGTAPVVATEPGIYSFRHDHGLYDKEIERVVAVAPHLTPGSVAASGHHQLSARGYEAWRSDSIVKWSLEAGDPVELDPKGDCVDLWVPDPGLREFKVLFRTADGITYDVATQENFFYDGPIRHDRSILPGAESTDLEQLWLTREGLARLEAGEISVAPLPFTGAWGPPVTSDDPDFAAPIQGEEGLIWILGYSDSAVFTLSDGVRTPLTSGRSEAWVIGDLNGDGVAEVGTDEGIFDPITAQEAVEVRSDPYGEGSSVRVLLRGGLSADYDGDGVDDLAVAHLTHEDDSSIPQDTNTVHFVQGPVPSRVELETGATSFWVRGGSTYPKLAEGDLDQDGYTDLLYASPPYGMVEVAYGGLSTWERSAQISSPKGGSNLPQVTDDALLLSGRDLGWSIPLPIQSSIRLEYSTTATAWPGSSEMQIGTLQAGDLDGDGALELFGSSEMGMWWVE